MASVVARDIDQTPEELKVILGKIIPWNITRKQVHTGTSKRVYVKGPTVIQPTEPWAYLTSRLKTMRDSSSLIKEYKYTRYLSSLFDDLIVPEYPINVDNRPLTNILNAGRGLLITKKDIVRNSYPHNAPYNTEELLKFMMASTDILIDRGFANLDLKPPNIGITDRFRINDN